MEAGDIGNGESVPYDTNLGRMQANINVQILHDRCRRLSNTHTDEESCVMLRHRGPVEYNPRNLKLTEAKGGRSHSACAAVPPTSVWVTREGNLTVSIISTLQARPPVRMVTSVIARLCTQLCEDPGKGGERVETATSQDVIHYVGTSR